MDPDDLQTPPHRELLGELSADGSSRMAFLPPAHNRWQVVVQLAAGVSAGDVKVFVEVKNPEGIAIWVRAKAGTVAYDADGGEAHGSVAPVGPKRLQAVLSGYVGAGGVTLVLETWREG